jgi:hypothetical protein
MSQPSGPSTILLEVAPGELLDKWSILTIKLERMTDADKRRNVAAELAIVQETRRRAIPESPVLEDLVRELKTANEELWDIENEIRDCEKAQDFGPVFVNLARLVYMTNDRRAHTKKQINELLGAKFREEKDYH